MNDFVPFALISAGVAAGVFAFAGVRSAKSVDLRFKALGRSMGVAGIALLLAFAAMLVLAASAPHAAIGRTPEPAEVRAALEAMEHHERQVLFALAGLVLQLALFAGAAVPALKDLAAFVREHDADLRGRDQAALAKRG
ncbi:MAG: hypothetical protein U1E73_01755 [Planctomycetota bacterium]